MNNDINLTEGAITEVLNNKVDLDFNNVASNSVGFARCSTEVTNCITEIPQRIKYTLEDGTLTIKAGSVAIIPYGTEDLTAQYPVGSTFLHDNFKVYDTQFADGKFFVWVELVNDVSRKDTIGSTDTNKRIINLNSTGSFGKTTIRGVSGGNPSAETYALVYNTTTNRIGYTQATTTIDYSSVASLPLLITNVDTTNSYMYGTIDQVFNGIGYIGSTVWVDKGVKALLTNGRNENGTLKSIEVITPSVLLNVSLNTGAKNITAKLALDGNNKLYLGRDSDSYYDFDTNYYVRPDGLYKTSTVIATVDTLTTGITSFNAPKAFMAVDYNSSKTVIQTYQNGTSWYRVYSDGWCEQGGKISIAQGSQKVTFIKPYKNTNISVQCTSIYSSSWNGMSEDCGVFISGYTATDVTLRNTYGDKSAIWEAKGYIS